MTRRDPSSLLTSEWLSSHPNKENIPPFLRLYFLSSKYHNHDQPPPRKAALLASYAIRRARIVSTRRGLHTSITTRQNRIENWLNETRSSSRRSTTSNIFYPNTLSRSKTRGIMTRFPTKGSCSRQVKPPIDGTSEISDVSDTSSLNPFQPTRRSERLKHYHQLSPLVDGTTPRRSPRLLKRSASFSSTCTSLSMMR